jgi:arylformamidase
MRIYDVTLTISPDLVVWPGDPDVVTERVQKIEDGDVANVTRLEMSAHTGTHVDAPFHFIQKGKTVEELSLKLLTGRAYVVHIPEADLITNDVIEAAGIPPRTRRVLFKTRNSKQWSKKNHKDFNPNYVGLAPDAAETLIQRGVKLVGVDYLSIAPFEELAETHNVLLNAGIVIVEGLDLSQVDPGRYSFYCLPLKIAGADGAPARALLIGV